MSMKAVRSKVGSGTKLDYETRTTYMVTLTAEDSFGATASIVVTIMVADMDEAPTIMVGGLAISGRSSVSYAENGTDAVETYMVSGPDAALARWSLEGADASDFAISSRGVLTFKSSPDYETKTTYMVTLKVDDGTYTDTHDVTIRVTDVDEMVVVPVDSLLDTYDTNRNGEYDKDEVIAAIRDYLDEGAPSKAQIIEIIKLYLR